MSGLSYEIRNNDTVSFETIRLELINDEIFYIPNVRNQNQGKQVRFKLISFDDTAVFENKKHDFPQRIYYSIKDDMLEAAIEGESNGKTKKIPFTFYRSSNNKKD
jgi:hypothetical protein